MDKIRVTKGGTAQSDSKYDFAFKGLRTDTTFMIIYLILQVDQILSNPIGGVQGLQFQQAGVMVVMQ